MLNMVHNMHSNVNTNRAYQNADFFVHGVHTKTMLYVAEIRKRKKWSQEKLAEKANMSRPWLSRIETGEGNFTKENLIEIAMALDVTVPELFGYAHPPDANLTAAQRALIGLVSSMPDHQVHVLLATARAMRGGGSADL